MNTTKAKLTKGGVLLLGVDDGLQRSARAALEADYYQVIPVAGPDQAQALLDDGAVDIAVVQSDCPPEEIAPLAAEFKSRQPHLRVIGIVEPGATAPRTPGTDVNLWLEQPLGPNRLVTAVNRLLADARSESFREELLRRQKAPLACGVPYRYWGLNE